MKTVQEVMSRPVRVVEPHATLSEVAEAMREEDTGIIPIVEGGIEGQLVGILTDRDIVTRVLAQDLDPLAITAREVMSSPVVTCYEDEDIERVAQVMEEKQIRRLVVVDREDHIVGMVSIGDFANRGATVPLVGQIVGKVSEPPHQPRL